MAITVEGKNYTQISSCDLLTSGGTWTGVDTPDTVDKKQGASSLCGTLKAAGDNNTNFVPTAAVNLYNKHIRFWFLITSGGLVNTYALGGIQFWCTGGGVTGYWYVGGRDTYPGGWCNFVVDLSKPVDGGTKPNQAGMEAVTALGTRHNLTIAGKNVDNVWIDNFTVSDGLITYGDDAGGYYDFNDIYDIENDPSTGGFGILTRKAGVYCLVGSLEIGDASGTAGTKFNAKSQVVVFENRPNKDDTLSNINANLMNMTIVDNGTGTTEFILGEKSGTQGISGCTVRVQNTTQIAKFDLIATDTDISDFQLYGSNFLDADSIELPLAGTNIEVLNCNFESCGEIIPQTCVVKYCNVISANDRGIRIAGLTHGISDCNFISCPHGMNFSFSSESPTLELNGIVCSGSNGSSLWDAEHSVAGNLIVDAVDSSINDSYVEETAGGDTAVNNAVNLIIKTVSVANVGINGIRCYIEKLDKTELMNMLTTTVNLEDGIAKTTFNYPGSEVDINIRIRKSSTGGTRYIPISTIGEINSGGYNLTAIMAIDGLIT